MNYCFLLMLVSMNVFAKPALDFKPESQAGHHSLIYLFAFFACLGLIFILAKWQKTHKKNSQQTQLIERFDLNAKTKAYVIEYHGQQFLIAEHPQALAIHLIPPKGISQDV